MCFYHSRIIKEDEISRAYSTNDREEKRIKVIVRKPNGKRPLGRPRRRWMDNIKMDLGET
jgi:hypothetical protein